MRAVVVVIGLVVVAGCAAPASPEPTDEPTPEVTPEGTATPNPAATPDPTRFAFATEFPTVTEVSTETADGVTVTDLTFEAAGVAPTEAYLVAAENGEPGPGILWFHWLETGDPSSNRTEFLEEARAMGAHGAVSLLVQGTLPWREDPSSIARDVPAIEAEVRMLKSALDLLATRPEVDSSRPLAMVGHDFGGMYGSVFFGADLHLDALVVMAPTARWADWFYRYWQVEDTEADYLAALAPVDPLTWLPLAAPRPVLLQFGSTDRFVPEAVAEEITAAAGASADSRTYDTGHHLDEAARDERDAWLAEILGLE